MRIIVPDAARDVMIEAALRAYPEECCGALLGTIEGDNRVVARALPIANERNTERRTRYLIGPAEYRAVDAIAQRDGYDVIGFYHSHPDHPAIPSAFDREQAWPWYVYIIVPVRAAQPGAARAWQLAEDRSAFVELGIADGAVEAIAEREAT